MPEAGNANESSLMTSRRRPRLLMLLHDYYPDEPRVAAEARAALDAGFDVDVVALRRPGDPARADVDGVRCIRLPLEHRRGLGVRSTLAEYLRFVAMATVAVGRLAARRRYDVVQVHTPPDFLILGAIVPRLLGARLVLDVHDLGSDMFMMRFGDRPGARMADGVLRAVERWSGRAADAVLTVHEPYRRELGARGIPESRITVVMNSLDERLLPPQSPDPSRNSFRVVYHGTVTPHYGVGLVVEATAAVRDHIPGFRFEIYGEGDALPMIDARARELGVEDAVHVKRGYLPQLEVLRAVQGASAGVVPNLPIRLNRFALSTKLLEYVALGIPVITADLPTIREHFSEDEVRFFDPGDASSLASALVDVAADPDRAARRVAAARRRYESYRWTRNATVYVDVLRRLASTRTA